ncbi:glycoside hydrolase family 39 protein [Amylocarpus encephaloides]|uniref:Glycoside hydrolase family 39 protein n=1 Tax=Amylocarpus encephaloides TaxID=45428 RepID=A0A9P7Y9A2_9HELO|nr:glycoside hydrolase family 39 protein [Amylocarpus encephaloides]
MVSLGNNTGATNHLASGIRYGIPDTPNQIPGHSYAGVGFNYTKAGGAQVGASGRGWICGLSEYKNPSTPYPGDNGDWWDRDAYLTQKEPPLVKLIGPEFSGQPDASRSWWTNHPSFVKSNGSIPGEWVWHMEGGGGDMETTFGPLYSLLKTYGLARRPINIDEYATVSTPLGLRGNCPPLHGLLAPIVARPNAANSNYNATGAGYFATGQLRLTIGTSPPTDRRIDASATVGSDMLRVRTGARTARGTWQVTINDPSAAGLPESGAPPLNHSNNE